MKTETTALTEQQMYDAAISMQRDGGSFASAIAKAYFHADSTNRETLLKAFGELFERHVNYMERKWG